MWENHPKRRESCAAELRCTRHADGQIVVQLIKAILPFPCVGVSRIGLKGKSSKDRRQPPRFTSARTMPATWIPVGDQRGSRATNPEGIGAMKRSAAKRACHLIVVRRGAAWRRALEVSVKSRNVYLHHFDGSGNRVAHSSHHTSRGSRQRQMAGIST